ncbi:MULTISPECIES: hypothetical protein [unclassified Variovorax]|uniref:hypothetical protein n=1 Tax=unclassified Variovorax TaxID=663243 RepID=UPI001315ECAC|nr:MULTISPECIES: hypothetical protein [unclassified Variovorax]VTU42379.1 hypothetical protein H6P1_00171 [Variovorax sp. PBL-H6]VTU43999.1 hypothetical protein SRS16P1_00731 [Variovorax sp. SRS16]VTU44084.1 hypothetical protein E5P1_00724 [Variovorax sp. PBL-E5]
MNAIALPHSSVPAVEYSHFDLVHWLKVKAARAQRNAFYPSHHYVPGHPLVGKQVIDKTTGRKYVVENVRKDWLRGWFLRAQLVVNGSHRVCLIDNLCCRDAGILKEIDRFKAEFSTVH